MIDTLGAIAIDRKRLDPSGQQRLREWAMRAATAPGPEYRLLVETCERVELYAAQPLDALDAPRGAIRLRGIGVARRLFRIAAGLESRLIGETQVVGQIRAAADRAGAEGTLCPALTRLVRSALRAGNHARAASGLDRLAHSHAQLAANRAARSGGRVGVIGTGSLAREVGRALARTSIERAVILGRHEARTRDLAATLGLAGAPLSRLPALAPGLDALVTAVSSPRAVVDAAALGGASNIRVIDLGVPPNTSPAIAGRRGVTRITLEELTPPLQPGRAVIDHAESIVEQELDRFVAGMRSPHALPQPRPWRSANRFKEVV